MEEISPFPSPIHSNRNVQVLGLMSQRSMITEHMHSTAISQGLYEQSTLPDNVEDYTVFYSSRAAVSGSVSFLSSFNSVNSEPFLKVLTVYKMKFLVKEGLLYKLWLPDPF